MKSCLTKYWALFQNWVPDSEMAEQTKAKLVQVVGAAQLKAMLRGVEHLMAMMKQVKMRVN